MTAGTLKATEFQWEIDISCFKDKNVGNYLPSPKFSCKKCNSLNDQWRLQLYPNGNTDKSKGYLSLYLYNLSSNKVTATYSFSLINPSGIKVENTRGANYSFESSNKSSKLNNNGFPQFVLQSFVMASYNNILNDNKLTISCNLVIEDIEPEDKLKNKEEIENKKQSNRLKFLDSYEQLMMNEEFSDISIKAEGKSFYLHKCILTARSVVFEGMFRHDMKEKIKNTVEIEDIRHEVLEELFRFIYTGKVSNNAEDLVSELLTASEKYCVEDLKSLCEETMSDTVNQHNVFEYFDSAILNKAEKLETELIKFMSLNLEDIIKNVEFDILGLKHPEVLLKIMKKHMVMHD